MSELVTGEAVALELRPAKLPSRVLAVLLDLAVTMTVYILVTIALVASTSGLDEAARTALSIATFVLVLVGGPIAVETLSHGRSLGKLACGLRVVRDDGGPIQFRHALVRGAVGVIEILMTFGVIACIASLVSARGRRLGDVFAGTLVVRERVPAGRAGLVPPPPPWLAGRFSQLDLSAVPDGLWLAIRQYLTRMQQLDPQVGWSMAERLASDLGACTGTPAPHEVPPAAYLAAVMQERQAREARRAFVAPAAGQVAGLDPTAPGIPGGYAPAPQKGPAPSPGSAPWSAPVPAVGGSPWSAPGSSSGDDRSGAAGHVQPYAHPGHGPSAPDAPQEREPAASRTEPSERRGTGFVPPA
ncbi:RDD family protein [Streptomyces chiangmaiensis]|uniref:RDD family protein n=1 Tax=Streptomyces chiangmaiensis TaxID=766497 RepID=A0ABU7FGC8_9ACTN|nr:RDD family protein [Streptomyces chiangmaiensis]MED7822985.1 RDD family protein [Streptomyces chiangmaiensis]